MEHKYSCYMFLADEPAQKEVLTVFCDVKGYSQEEAYAKVAKELQANKKDHNYDIKYVGVIQFAEVDQDIIDRQNELFDKYDSVWVLNCSYKNKSSSSYRE
ncbi:hypothetical protein G4D61_03275 [Bacillus ginsengihumi]|uniref:Uncharacterized protein n=1 Tax=Heyndrickxia ginsengihumi TaxID=363870 RepID=A0A6M0P335_9BACI|nr:hypothetical protein [Heyndrickxia ginsengihumi]NEY18991.1 hypothetical protein [Heyndrickxia ginsengihumi]